MRCDVCYGDAIRVIEGKLIILNFGCEFLKWECGVWSFFDRKISR